MGTGSGWGIVSGIISWIILLAIVDLVLRGMALWKSARNGQNGWFIALLVINSMGILPLIYLLIYRDTKKKSSRKR